MADLYPTPTRLQLLAEIANGQVLTDITRDYDVVLRFPDAPTSWESRHQVTDWVRQMEQAGWVEESVPEWSLTDAGREVLEVSRG